MVNHQNSRHHFWLYHTGSLGVALRLEAEWLSFNDRFDDALDVPPLPLPGMGLGDYGRMGGWSLELGASTGRTQKIIRRLGPKSEDKS